MTTEAYVPVLVFLIIGVVFGLGPVVLGLIFGPHRPDPTKNAPYECGFPAYSDQRMPFDARFYLVAILFIIFDLETAFLFPWAVVMKHIHWLGILSMALFIVLLLVGFAYEWGKGALDWE